MHIMMVEMVIITIQSTGSYEYMAYQSDNKLTVSLKRPEDKNPLRPKAANHYTGKKNFFRFPRY